MAAAWLAMAGGGVAQAAGATRVAVCCAWGQAIKGGLTYKVASPDGPGGRVHARLASAIERWDELVGPLTLDEVPLGTRADVTVRFTPGPGAPHGVARLTFAGPWVTSADITVSGSPSTTVGGFRLLTEVMRHEMGHALGAGHANGDDRTMSPVLTVGIPITDCDVAAVVAAQHWFLVDHAGTPHGPHRASVPC